MALEQHNFTFSVPPTIFRHSNFNETLEFNSIKSDGSPLPNWLHFNSKQLKYKGNPPKGSKGAIDIMITANDRYGNKAHATFKITVNKDDNSGSIIKAQEAIRPTKFGHHAQAKEARLIVAGKASFTDQLGSSGKTDRLIESRALLDSLNQLYG